MNRFLITLILTIATLSDIPCAFGANYKLTLLAKPGDIIGGVKLLRINPSVAMNDSGEVVFSGSFDGPLISTEAPSAIFTQSALVANAGSSIGGFTITQVGGAVIDNSGTIVFSCTSSFGAGFCTRTAVLVKRGDTIGGITLINFGDHSISSNGTFVFVGFFGGVPGGPSSEGIFTPAGLIVKTGDSIAGHILRSPSFQHPVVNNLGTIAFLAGFEGNGAGIFTPSSLVLKQGDTISGQLLTTTFSDLDINESGTIIDVGSMASGAHAIYSPSSILVKDGDAIGGVALNNIQKVAINNRGTIAFTGAFPGGAGGAFTSGLFTRDTVIARQGDVIGGKTVSFLDSVASNNSGRIAFSARFSDGTFGIVLADPQ